MGVSSEPWESFLLVYVATESINSRFSVPTPAGLLGRNHVHQIVLIPYPYSVPLQRIKCTPFSLRSAILEVLTWDMCPNSIMILIRLKDHSIFPQQLLAFHLSFPNRNHKHVSVR